ncbi:MAG: HdeD family acid-resistance protein [Planctomycetota bacterium]
MPSLFPRTVVEDLTALRNNWGWLLAFGIASVIVGMMAIGSACIATLAVVQVFAILILVGGIINLVGSFWARGWGGFFLHLLVGVLYVVAGFLLWNHPAQAAIVYTLLLAMFFIVEGLFRIIGSIAMRFHNWGWVLLSGVITVVLGVLIWRQWPYSGIWVIGLFVGIDLIFNGWAWIMLALTAKNLPDRAAAT